MHVHETMYVYMCVYMCVCMLYVCVCNLKAPFFFVLDPSFHYHCGRHGGSCAHGESLGDAGILNTQ